MCIFYSDFGTYIRFFEKQEQNTCMLINIYINEIIWIGITRKQNSKISTRVKTTEESGLILNEI